MRYWVIISFLFCAMLAFTVQSETTAVGETPSVNSKIQKLKKRAEQLHQALTQLEQELLFPASSQLAVYVSMDTTTFDVDSIEMTINGQRVANYLYSQEQVTALAEGAMQQLYLDNVRLGTVEIEIVINGKKNHNSEKTATRYNTLIKKRFHKGNEALIIDFVIDTAAENARVVTTLVQR